MALTESRITDGTLTISMIGRVDSTNAAAFSAEAEQIISGGGFDSLILDAEKLDYISSAGLRVVLSLRKKFPTLRIIGVNPDVYEIFEMTGFTEMIQIEKAYRRLSVDGCEVIGRGANGEVYRLDPDTIIKVYLNSDALPDIQRERELARRAFVLGVPTAIPYDVVKVGDSYGSVFELLNSESFAKILSHSPERFDEIMDMYVDLLLKIHSTKVLPEDMPDMREVALDWVDYLRDYLPADIWDRLHNLVEAVPVRHTMMHGDYHLKNVMLQDGEALLIDMDTLCQGDPVFEFGSIFNAYIGFSALDHGQCQKFMGIPYDLAVRVWHRTLTGYFGTDDPEILRRAEERSQLVGFVRLMRRSIRRGGLTKEPEAVEYYKEQIIRLVGSIESLSFDA
ncbi:MAG: phosphotransferase [Lachnospiraceae bacterium]|nr:phosphotransferase [Lachnospiraceae bacterium]